MLQLEGVAKYYYSGNNIVMALRKINLQFKIGEFVAITGESGSGKSTLLNVLSGLDTYEDGKMFIHGKDISHYSVAELEDYRRQYIGFVFQDYNIIDSYTVYQNIDMALTIQGYSKEERKERVYDLIKQVGLTKQAKQKASKLSGGEKQRTVIARALAKDCPIIVCDEPTGNLDTESSQSILRLLHEISKDKLVLIVTHNLEEVEEFATRKVRLYDGEIVEDTKIKQKENVEQEVHLKPYKTSLNDMLYIAKNNVLSVPRKSFFTLLIISFMIVAFVFAFGFTLQARNTSLRSETDYFNNAFPGRIVITKRDNSVFTDTELETLKDINFVRDVFEYDFVFDTTLIHARFNEEFDITEFFEYKILPAVGLDIFDVDHGRLPENEYEVVVGDNGLFEIGDYIGVSNEYEIKKIEGIETNQFVFEVVGLKEQSLSLEDSKNEIYLHRDALLSMQYTSTYENSEIKLDIDSLHQYSLVSDVRIDNTVPDDTLLLFDMYFFDICRDFGWREEVVDDFDAGLCPPEEFFIPFHDFGLTVMSRFENDPISVPIELQTTEMIPHQFGQGVYVNKYTFEKLFFDDVYQPTVIVYDMFEANQVVEELEELGYNVFYPSGVIDEDDAIPIILRNLQLSLTLGITIVLVYLVGYFVLRNIILSKKKDYLVFRSVGTSKKAINIIMILEMMYITMVSFIIVMIVLLINETFDTAIPRLLRYFSFPSYLLLFITVYAIMFIMARNFNNKLFGRSVISSLKMQ